MTGCFSGQACVNQAPSRAVRLQEAGGSRVALWIASSLGKGFLLWEVIYFNHILIHTHTHTAPTQYDLFVFNSPPWRFPTLSPPATPRRLCPVLWANLLESDLLVYDLLISRREWATRVRQGGGGGGTLILPSHTGSAVTSEESVMFRKAASCVTAAHSGVGQGPLLMAHEHTRWERVLPPFILWPITTAETDIRFEWDTLIWQAGPHTWLVVV